MEEGENSPAGFYMPAIVSGGSGWTKNLCSFPGESLAESRFRLLLVLQTSSHAP